MSDTYKWDGTVVAEDTGLNLASHVQGKEIVELSSSYIDRDKC